MTDSGPTPEPIGFEALDIEKERVKAELEALAGRPSAKTDPAQSALPFIADSESVKITVQEIIRMRRAGREAYGNIKDMSVEARTRRIIEVHACVSKMKVFLQEMVTSEAEAMSEMDEVTREARRKLDRQYRAERGKDKTEKAPRKPKATKGQKTLEDLASSAGIDLSILMANLKAKKEGI